MFFFKIVFNIPIFLNMLNKKDLTFQKNTEFFFSLYSLMRILLTVNSLMSLYLNF